MKEILHRHSHSLFTLSRVPNPDYFKNFFYHSCKTFGDSNIKNVILDLFLSLTGKKSTQDIHKSSYIGVTSLLGPPQLPSVDKCMIFVIDFGTKEN